MRHIDFYRHDLTPDDVAQISKVVESRFLTTGRVASGVEAQLADYFNAPHAIVVNSWTNGAIATLLAMGIGPGDEVIVPAMTFVASVNVIELVGATPVFADCDPETLLITPEFLLPLITERTKAVIPVHLYGQMCDVAGLRKIIDARSHGQQLIMIIEDCAHCFEGELDGQKPCTHGDVAIFSFYATKNVTCGEGGAIVLRDPKLYETILQTRLHGMSAIAINRIAGGKYNHWDVTRVGTKANLPDLLAALLPRQIETIESRLPARIAMAERYASAFADGPLRLQKIHPDCTSAHHLFTIGVPGGKRDAAIAALNSAGVNVTVNYRAVPCLSFYADRYPDSALRCKHATEWGEQTISLPFFPSLTKDEQDYVIDIVKTQVYPLAE